MSLPRKQNKTTTMTKNVKKKPKKSIGKKSINYTSQRNSLGRKLSSKKGGVS